MAAGLLLGACGDAPTGAAPPGVAAVLFAVRGAHGVQAVAVEVSGPGIDSLLLFNIPVIAGAGSGTARVPAGAGRHFTLRAYDAIGVVTHRGDTTVTLVEGPNPQLDVVLQPLSGTLPIVVTFGGSGVTIAPGDTSIAVGDTVRYIGGGVDSLGAVILPLNITWSSTDPGVAAVNPQGLVSARASGTAYVLATHGGASVGRQITVQ